MESNGRTTAQVRIDLAAERDQLASAVEHLRTEIGAAADVSGKLRAKLPVVVAGAVGAGFVLAGGVGATVRLLTDR